MYIAYQTSRKLCTILVDNHIIPPENSKYYLYCFEFVFDNILFNAFLFLLGILLTVPLQAVVYIITTSVHGSEYSPPSPSCQRVPLGFLLADRTIPPPDAWQSSPRLPYQE